MKDVLDKPANSPEELASELGDRLRALRLSQALTQATVADKAGISLRALRELEAGRGSTVLTLVRVLKALGIEQGLQALAPQPTISPMAMLQRPQGRARGNR
ncbi:MAG TPA: helix-turn-helix domain-containing protein [Thermomonas sp.]|nr:helix-turn-helix domain-containing protein [Thermomonas sp.]